MWMSLLTADHINNNFIIYTNKACLTSTFEITSELVSLAITGILANIYGLTPGEVQYRKI
jgi:hypothetical protein